MGKKAYMGPMQDPNGINAQILPIWVPYIHVCWVVCFETLVPFVTESPQEISAITLDGAAIVQMLKPIGVTTFEQ